MVCLGAAMKPNETEADERSLHHWMEAEMNFASVGIRKSVSATDLVMNRDSFGQVIVPKPGSIVAAPATDLSGGDPDYFFHWLRDSSLVMDALRVLHRRGRMPDLARAFGDFVAFSLSLNALNGPARLKQGDIREGVSPDFLTYVRTEDDLMSVVGDAPLGEVRFNPDGTLDIIRWSRPQNDGPALRALMTLRHFRLGEAFSGQAAADLASGDLDFIERQWREPCYDLWEEERGHHYYTRLVQMAALDAGAKWMAERGESRRANSFRLAANEIAENLAEHWAPGQRFYLSRLGDDPTDPRQCLDASIILAAIHADREGGAHSVLDPRMQSTVEKLEALFKAEYHNTGDAIDDTRGPAMGRYADDAYAPGAAWYITTSAAAEFHYRVADRLAKGHRLTCTAENASFLTRILGIEPSPGPLPSSILGEKTLIHAFVKRGDAFMATMRDFTPASGELSEQFDPSSGRQKSAKNLAWSYAAFITACDARDEAARAADSG